MKPVTFSYDNALLGKTELEKTAKKLESELKALNRAARGKYEDDRASINLPVDAEFSRKVRGVARRVSALKPEYLVVAGIGGSNLGTIAVQEAVLGKLHNQLGPKVKVLYADTVDADSMTAIKKIIEPALRKGRAVVLNGVSKSGGTAETIANFEVLVSLLKKHRRDYRKCVVVTTDKGSRFWSLAEKEGFATLEVPGKVGGRYSMFSPVGLFPLAVLGVSVDKLLKGAANMRKRCLQRRSNPAMESALTIYSHQKKGKNIHDLFVFANDLESVGKWYRQLMGESVGKEKDRKGKKVFAGITPTVSVGSTDLHSMAQLYLGGPFDKFTTFVRLEQFNNSIKVPALKEYDELVNDIQGVPYRQLMGAIVLGVQRAFKKGKRPFCEIVLPDKSEESIGQLLQLKMMEMMFLGALMNVNPFDQPNVEAYKRETKKILEK